MVRQKTLAMLTPGESALVSLLHENIFTCKLMNLGILPNTRITLVRRAPFGKTLYIKLGNYQMAIREEEAQTIILEDTL